MHILTSARSPSQRFYFRIICLMFDDDAWLGDEAPGPLGHGHSQPRCYRAWESAVKAELKANPRKRLVILELGCGLRVPTVRRHAERLLRST